MIDRQVDGMFFLSIYDAFRSVIELRSCFCWSRFEGVRLENCA